MTNDNPRWRITFARSIGALALSAFLILWGLLAVTNFQIEFSGPLLGFLALVAGVCLLLGI